MRNLSTKGALSQDRFPAAAGSESLNISNVFGRVCDAVSSPDVGVSVDGPKPGLGC